MARKKELQKDIAQIQEAIAKKKAIIGTKRALTHLRTGKLVTVFTTSNCPASVKEDVDYYTKLTKCDVHELKYTNEELGVLCKKPFSISVVGLLK
ncbi:ribosomal L7Ae/L30e/S12e/Gadd45 family protein [Candidatus Woesearchaeota archaeon]|nr:ribosomal L7Ae/L30e/S12e/Gadd45 family protein [Candidatus Woesearchaeota archaeon]